MTFLAAIAFVVAAIWGAVFLHRAGLLAGCLAVLIAGSCFGHAFFRLDVGPLPVTVDRLLLGFLGLFYVLRRRLDKAPKIAFDLTDVLMIAFIVVLCVTTLMHDWRADGAKTVARLLFFFVLPFALYCVARESTLSPKALRGMFACLAIFGFYLAVTAVAERFEFWALVFPKYIASAEYYEFFGRGRGPYLNPVANGFFLSAGWCALLLIWPQFQRTGRTLLVVAAVVFAAGVYCTLTRSVWLGAFGAVIALIGLQLPNKQRWGLVAGVALIGLAVVAVKWDDLKAFKRDKFVSVTDMEKSASLRPILASIAWRMFQDRPFLGCGLGRYEDAHLAYVSERSAGPPLDVARGYVQHNVFLSLLTETGAIGAGIFALVVVQWVRSGWNLWRNRQYPAASRQLGLLFLAVLFFFLTNGMLHDVSIMPMVNMLVFFLAGATRGALAQSADSALAAPERAPQPGSPSETAILADLG